MGIIEELKTKGNVKKWMDMVKKIFFTMSFLDLLRRGGARIPNRLNQLTGRWRRDFAL